MSLWIDLEQIEAGTWRDIGEFLYEEIDWDAVIQFCVAILSIAAIAMIATTGTWHRWGFVVGLASQPFWIAATWRARTTRGRRLWGMIVLSFCYVFVWCLGIGERFPALF